MKLRKAGSALAGLAILSAPVAASAAPIARAATPVAGERLGDSAIGWAMAALIAVVAGILVFTDGDEDPVSP